MDYEIDLPKQVNGDKLVEALEHTLSSLEWGYTKDIEAYSVASDSLEMKPTKIEVTFKPWRSPLVRFLSKPIETSPRIELNERYSKLGLYRLVELDKKRLERFSSILSDTIESDML